MRRSVTKLCHLEKNKRGDSGFGGDKRVSDWCKLVVEKIRPKKRSTYCKMFRSTFLGGGGRSIRIASRESLCQFFAKKGRETIFFCTDFTVISLSVHLYFRYYENSSLVEGENVEMIPTYVCT